MSERPPFCVAHIDTTHGLRGEVSARLLTDFPDRFADLSTVRVGRNGDQRRLCLEGWRLHRGKVLLKMEGIDDIDAARALVGQDVWVDAEEAIRLPPDMYFHRDLIGMQVRNRNGDVLGKVREILVTGGTDVLVVESDAGEILVPTARSICVEVDLEAGFLVVDPPEGLLDVNAV